MQIELTKKEFRYLLDLVYIGNWILNATRGENRFAQYDNIESMLFGLCRNNGMHALVEDQGNGSIPSRAYTEGGIQEAITLYEDTVFYELLAEHLARRDLDYPEVNDDNYAQILNRMGQYMAEFQANGLDRVSVGEE